METARFSYLCIEFSRGLLWGSVVKSAKDCQNLVDMLMERVSEYGDAPFLWSKYDGAFQPQSWNHVAGQIAKLAWALTDLGVRPGDRVALISENRPEWLISDMAIMVAGGITVPTYITNTTRDHEHILQNSGAKGAIVSTERLAQAVLPAAHQSDALRFIVAMEPPKISQSLSVDIRLWDQVMEASEGRVEEVFDAVRTLKRDDTACIIYTSGTGGAPKGVMLHHGAILHNAAGATAVVEELGLKDDVFLCFLPLSHAYEHSGGQFLPISVGAQIYYAESIDKLAANMAEAHPTIMTVVPRLFELLRNRVLRGVREQGGLREKLFERALALGIKRYRAPESLGVMEKLEDRILDRLVRKKVQQRFGGRLKAMVSGGAPLNPEVGEFFMALGLRLLQGYGQTESGPVASVNRVNNIKMHTVGPPLDDTEIKIADDGEILIRGELVMQGYWRDEEATAIALQDGWLHTGDIGLLDEDGHLQITDRKKDIIVNDKGDTISPQRIEGMLTLEPEIAQAMIYGDRRPHLVGLLVPDPDWLAEWAKARGKEPSLAALRKDSDLHESLDLAVSRVNERVSNLEKIRRFAVISEPFGIDNQQMTPTMKIRRHVITDDYRTELDALY